MSVFETALKRLQELNTTFSRAKKEQMAAAGTTADAKEASTATAQGSEAKSDVPAQKVDVSAGIPHYNKGMILERRGDKTLAIECYLEAVKAAPDYFDAHANLARLLCEAERWNEALKHCEAALRLRPNSPRVHNNLAAALYQAGQFAEAIRHFTAALRLTPDDMVVLENLLSIRKHHPALENSEVVAESKVLCAQLADKHYATGFQLLKDGKTAEGITCWRQAVKFDPEWADLLNNIAWILATSFEENIRNGKEAMDLATRAIRFGGEQPRFMDTLAAAYAECGRFAEARRCINKVLPIVKTKGPLELAEALPARLKLYEENKPYRALMTHIKPARRGA